MGALDWKIFGVPEGHQEATQTPAATVKAPEFDITQYAKKLAVIVGVIFPAAIATAKAAGVEINSDIVVAGLVVTATALIAVSIVMATDVGARAYVTVHTPQTNEATASSGAAVVAAPLGMKVWLKDHGEEAYAVLAIDRTGDSASYLVAGGSTSQKQVPEGTITAYDQAPSWKTDDEVTALHLPTSA